MNIRRFRARDVSEALSKIREALGPDALILETRRVAASSRGPGQVVVLAASDPGPGLPPRPSRARRDEEPSVARLPLPATEEIRAQFEAERDKVRYLSRLVASDHFSRLTPWAREVYLDLVEADVDAELAIGMLQGLGAQETGKARLATMRHRFRSLVRTGGHLAPGRGRRQILVLAGGPGVGKTTTCAKLAARLRDAGESVGLMSLDTIRMAGAVHLTSYGEVLGLPAAVAYTPGDVGELLNGPLGPVSTILVDTPGLRWTDLEGVLRLEGLLGAMPGAAVHLVAAASMRVRDQVRHLALFRPLKPSALIFTKLDETDSYGCLLTSSLKLRLPIATVCDGQRVPEDMHPADREELLDLLLDGMDLEGSEETGSHDAERILWNESA